MPQLKLLLIGEARGETEDQHNHGFTGSSGIELAFMLRDSGLMPNIALFCPKCQLWQEHPNCKLCLNPLYPSPQDMIRHWKHLSDNHSLQITNVFEHHPPNNDLGYIFSPDAKSDFMPGFKYDTKRPISYIKPEFQHHVHTLWKRIEKTKPSLCLLLGNTACWAVLKQTKITEIRGTICQSPHLGAKCLPTFHPASILRNWPARPIVLADFTKANFQKEFPEIRRIKRKVIYHATLNEIENWLNQPTTRYTIDIESGYALFTDPELKNMTPNMRHTLSSQISMIGFARNPTDNLVVEFMTRNSPNLNYWPTQEEEVSAWKLVEKALSTPIPKTFQNGLYDICRLLYAGIKTRFARDDTMLLHHALYPELPKALGFLGSIYAEEFAWKTLYGKGEELKRDS